MATRTRGFSTTISAFVTGFVVPVLAQFLSNANKIDIVIHTEKPAAVTPAVPRVVPAEVQVIADGIGVSADEAWNDAIRNALRNLAASLVDGQTWSQSGMLICDQVLQDTRSIVVRCEDVRCLPEKGVWHRQVAIVLSRTTLAERLKASHWRTVVDAP